MRITSGKLKGLKIILPKKNIRASMDKMRERVFAILQNMMEFENANFLDLFTGSAVIAIEAYSRGFKSALGIEKDRGKKQIIEKNISHCNGAVEVVFAPVEGFLQFARGAFEIIFLDPPFVYKFKQDLLDRIVKSKIAQSTKIIAIHFPQEDSLEKEIGEFKIERQIKMGRSIVNFYRRMQNGKF